MPEPFGADQASEIAPRYLGISVAARRCSPVSEWRVIRPAPSGFRARRHSRHHLHRQVYRGSARGSLRRRGPDPLRPSLDHRFGAIRPRPRRSFPKRLHRWRPVGLSRTLRCTIPAVWPPPGRWRSAPLRSCPCGRPKCRARRAPGRSQIDRSAWHATRPHWIGAISRNNSVLWF